MLHSHSPRWLWNLRAALLTVLLLGASSAHAGIYGGYSYTCPSTCDGVRVTYQEPTPLYVGSNGEASDGAYIWIGIVGDRNNAVCGSTPGPLLQFGTAPAITSGAVQTHRIWKEEFGCNAVNFVSPTITIAAGDTVTLEILCTAGCTSGVSGQTWRLTWTNVTSGTSQVVNETGYTVYMNFALVEIEPWFIATNSGVNGPMDFTPLKFLNAQIHTGGAWVSMLDPTISPKTWSDGAARQVKCAGTCSPSTGTMHYYGVSPPIFSNSGTAFCIVSTIVFPSWATIPVPPCLMGAYSSTAGFGP